ncbi:hypothetical protein PRZ48_009111 [Zasmidium cellare]|uniref:Dihydrodipicolinate synthase n=1 Tax=Zasmidium cellare TaxID=395010 RepID=A0ABR0EHG1_ZASCE|nr:hypothetical protein PRZ48_009111 [Zasmidium cellare]
MAQATPSPPLSCGVYVASLTFFKPGNEQLDLDILEKHIARLARRGAAGIVALSSNGEAAHLSSLERHQVVSTIRKALDKHAHPGMPLIVGASAPSVAGTIRLCQEATDAGGDYVLVLPPSYYKTAMSDEAIFQFYKAVSAASPLPLIIYNYPDVAASINMDSDLIIRTSQQCSNVVGCKFTCGDTGKLLRVARAMNAKRPGHDGSGYWCAGGLADFLLQALVVGASGAIAGGANITPKTCVEVFRLFCEGRLEEASYAQGILAQGDWIHTRAGIGATKAVLQAAFGYGGLPRLPLTGVSEATRANMMAVFDPAEKPIQR